MNGVLALSWFEHRRTRGLCAGLGIELVVLDTPYHGLRRYLLLTARTIALLVRRRPAVLLVQNPSLVLSSLCVALRSAFGYRLIVDAHNEAVDPHEYPHSWVKWLSRWVIRRADLTIVTNRQLAQIVGRQGGRSFTLPDRIPVPVPGPPRAMRPGFNAVLIATFAKDEPINAIFEAVRGAELELFVTGNPSKLHPDIAARSPPNVHLTGFLADEDYWSLLGAADVIIDLTLRPDCLVCGAYEALALGKPVLLSGNAASLELFGDGALFTDNSPANIRRGIDRLRGAQIQQRAAAERKRDELREQWEVSARALSGELTSRSSGARSPTPARQQPESPDQST